MVEKSKVQITPFENFLWLITLKKEANKVFWEDFFRPLFENNFFKTQDFPKKILIMIQTQTLAVFLANHRKVSKQPDWQ